jgi:hypothetical protein
MRPHLIQLALCISCGDSATTAAREGEEPVQTYMIAGTVMDSVQGWPLPGIRVLVGDSSVTSDSFGRFSTIHRGGDFSLMVNDPRYEPYDAHLQILGNDDRQRPLLRGYAPYITTCQFTGDTVHATVIDLQGRKTINRRSHSTMTVVSDSAVLRRDANTWSWTPIDNLTWIAHIPMGGLSADSAVWRLEDADGYVRNGWCVKQPPPCVACAGSR